MRTGGGRRSPPGVGCSAVGCLAHYRGGRDKATVRPMGCGLPGPRSGSPQREKTTTRKRVQAGA